MAIKIDRKIVGYSVYKPDIPTPEKTPVSNVVEMHEKLERPQELTGSTYKIKVPSSQHAFYVTINDIVQPWYRTRAAQAFRNIRQFQEHGSLPMDRGFDAHHVRGIPQRWRYRFHGRRIALCIRPARRIFQEGREIHAIAGGRDWRRVGKPLNVHRHDHR